jgi:biopolymer transport protein ExbD
MHFMPHKRRRAPSIIIISLIDVLMVVLIFMMVSTTFRQHPAIKLALPESKQSKAGAAEVKPLIVTVSRSTPHLYLENNPVTLEKLQQELTARTQQNPTLSLFIRADTDAPFGEIIKVMDAAKAANIRVVNAFTKGAGQK